MESKMTQENTAPVSANKAGLVALNSLLALSGGATTLLFTYGGSLLFAIAGAVLSIGVCVVVLFRLHPIETSLRKPKPLPLIFGVVLAVFTALTYRTEFIDTTSAIVDKLRSVPSLFAYADIVGRVLPTLVCVFAIPALFLWFYLFTDHAARFVRRWKQRANRTEKLFLLVGFLIAVAAVSLVYGRTNAFYGSSEPYDVIYTTDSSNLVKTNVFFYVNAYENDIRQPLFAVFSMPFAAVAMILSKLLFFVPNAYPILLACVQALVMLFGFTLLSRVLRLTGVDQLLFLCLLSVSYPTMLFLFTIEQYVFSVFWLIVLVYLWAEQEEPGTMAYVAATGSLLTSGVFFPLLFTKKGFRDRVRSLIAAALAFLAVFVVFARVPLLNHPMQALRDLSSFTGESVGFGNRALQYFNFIAACFTQPNAGLDLTTNAFASYQLSPVTGVNVLGMIVLLLAATSTLLQLKDRTIRVFACWAAFSVLLLMVVGWGAAENGMVLYTLYFSWAFAALLDSLLRRVLPRRITLRRILAALVVLALACVNISGMIGLVRFAVAYFPAA